MQQVGRGVVALGRVPGRAVDVRVNALADVDRPALGDDREHLVVAEPQHVLDARAAVALQALDVARIGDLAAAGRIERRLDELDQHPSVSLSAAPIVVSASVVS